MTGGESLGSCRKSPSPKIRMTHKKFLEDTRGEACNDTGMGTLPEFLSFGSLRLILGRI